MTKKKRLSDQDTAKVQAAKQRIPCMAARAEEADSETDDSSIDAADLVSDDPSDEQDSPVVNTTSYFLGMNRQI